MAAKMAEIVIFRHIVIYYADKKLDNHYKHTKVTYYISSSVTNSLSSISPVLSRMSESPPQAHISVHPVTLAKHLQGGAHLLRLQEYLTSSKISGGAHGRSQSTGL